MYWVVLLIIFFALICCCRYSVIHFMECLWWVLSVWRSSTPYLYEQSLPSVCITAVYFALWSRCNFLSFFFSSVVWKCWKRLYLLINTARMWYYPELSLHRFNFQTELYKSLSTIVHTGQLFTVLCCFIEVWRRIRWGWRKRRYGSCS